VAAWTTDAAVRLAASTAATGVRRRGFLFEGMIWLLGTGTKKTAEHEHEHEREHETRRS
jgi:hypothetical protein